MLSTYWNNLKLLSLNNKEESDLFWNLSLYYSTPGLIIILVVNCIILILVSLTLFVVIHDDPNEGYVSLLINILLWLINSILCLIVLCVMKLYPELIHKYTRNTLPEVWEYTGYYLLIVRILSGIYTVIQEYFGDKTVCYVIKEYSGM